MDTLHSLVLGNVTLPSGRAADITLAGGRVIHVGAGRKQQNISIVPDTL